MFNSPKTYKICSFRFAGIFSKGLRPSEANRLSGLLTAQQLLPLVPPEKRPGLPLQLHQRSHLLLSFSKAFQQSLHRRVLDQYYVGLVQD